VVLAATALALALRLTALGHESIWFDETASLKNAGEGYRALLTGRAYEPGNPAGYFVLLRAWLDLFGSGTVETARALSALAGALAVPAVWLLARASGLSRRAGWLACLLVAVSPPLVYLGQEARVFALFATVTTLALLAVVHIERDDRPAAWVGFAAAGAALVHLHYYGFLVLAVLGLHLLVWAWRRGRGPVLRLALVAAAVALAFAPYLHVLRQQLLLGAARSKDSWWQHLGLLPSFSIVGRTLVWKEAGRPALLGCALLVVAAVFVPVGRLLLRGRAWPRAVTAFALGLPALVALVSLRVPLANCHYLSAVFPAWMLLLACGLDAGIRGRARWALWVPAVTLAVLMPWALARVYLVPHKTDWRGLAALVGRDGDRLPVYFYEDIGEDPFRYYRPGQPRHRLDKAFGPGGAGWTAAGYLDEFRAAPGSFWVVLYLTSPQTLAEEGAIVDLLRRECVVEREASVPPMRAFLCRPCSPLADRVGGPARGAGGLHGRPPAERAGQPVVIRPN
jgi:hypothetical protein